MTGPTRAHDVPIEAGTTLRLENSFHVPVGIQPTWEALNDIERIVPCMPGASLTEVVDESTYKGTVSVRLGPVSLSFNGTAKFEQADETQHRAVVKTQGSDTKGRGGVAADVVFHLKPDGDGTRVDIETDLRLSGAVAQYGRGAGMIADVASHWIGEFAECLRARLSEDTELVPGTSQPEVQPGASKPMPVLGIGLKAVWNEIARRIRRLLGRD